jgi:hypothetical protein
MKRALPKILLLLLFAWDPASLAAEQQPITIVASTEGRFAKGRGHTWHIVVDGKGSARLKINTFPDPIHREFHVPPKELEKLARVVEDQGWFDLKAEYGERVPSGCVDTLTVTIGEQTNTVKIHFLMNWVHTAPEKLKEPAKAVRTFQVIRSWFSDPEAVDLTKYDEMILRAASNG